MMKSLKKLLIKKLEKKRIRLKFGKEKPNKNKIWEKNIANQKNYN